MIIFNNSAVSAKTEASAKNSSRGHNETRRILIDGQTPEEIEAERIKKEEEWKKFWAEEARRAEETLREEETLQQESQPDEDDIVQPSEDEAFLVKGLSYDIVITIINTVLETQIELHQRFEDAECAEDAYWDLKDSLLAGTAPNDIQQWNRYNRVLACVGNDTIILLELNENVIYDFETPDYQK